MIWLTIYIVGFLFSFLFSYSSIFAFFQGRRDESDQQLWEQSDHELALECSWYPSLIWPIGVFIVFFTVEKLKYGFKI